jgi:hypothetical protein
MKGTHLIRPLLVVFIPDSVIVIYKIVFEFRVPPGLLPRMTRQTRLKLSQRTRVTCW